MPRSKTASSPTRAPDTALLDALWAETVDRRVLPNGLTLIVKPDHSAALSTVQAWVRTGSIHEGADMGGGLSHFLEHMLFKGTARRAGREISATVQAHGGYINAYTTFDRTVYYIDLPSEHTGLALDILADVVFSSSLPEEEVVKERGVILREISMVRDDPDQRLWEAVFAAAYREHPYRHPVIGHRDVFERMGRAELADYYRRRYVPNNVVLVVVGDVEAAAVAADVERLFGPVPRARLAPVFIPPEPAQLAPRADHRFEAVEISRGVLSWPVPGLAHPDSPVLDLLALLLGAGDSSVLWQEVREKAGLVHAIDATCWNPGEAGLFCVSFTGEAGRREAAERAVGAAIGGRAARGFTAAEIGKARRQMIVSEINAHKTMGGQASRLGSAEVVVGDLNFARSYFARLGAVTSADLKRVIREYFNPARLLTVSLNPQAPAAPGSGAGPGTRRRAAAQVEEIRLASGSRLLFIPEARLPNLHVRLTLRGGPGAEDPRRRGSSGLLSTLLSKDTRRRSAAAVARRIEGVGGSLMPFCGNNSLGLAVETLPTDADLALGVLAEGILEPAFRPGTVGQERDAQLAQIKQDADDVVTYARRLLRRKFFGSHPLALDASGDEAGVGGLRPQDLSTLLARMLRSGNAVLAVAGDFNRRTVERAARRLLAAIPDGPAAPAGPGFGGAAEPGEWVETRACEQAVVLQGYPGAALSAPDFYVGEVADELFSGMASRLFERVREEKALAYFIRSARVSGADAALFSFIAGTQPGKEGEVNAEIDAEIERVAAGRVGQEEIQRCKARLKAGRRQALQTNGSRALQASLDALQGRPSDDWTRYDERVEAVGVRDLAAFARRHFARALSVRLVVRP